MTTSLAISTLSKPVPGSQIPLGTLGYFRALNRSAAYELVIGEFQASGITQAELARRLGKGTDVVCRTLGAPGNWGLDTISDYLFAISGAVPVYRHSYPLEAAARNDTQPASAWADTCCAAPWRHWRACKHHRNDATHNFRHAKHRKSGGEGRLMPQSKHRRRTPSRAEEPPLKITIALLCDDVRREFNGKELLIGVYGNRIILPSFPMALNLTVWMRALFRLPGPAKIEVRVIDDRGQAILPTITAEVLSPPEIKDEVNDHPGRGALSVTWSRTNRISVAPT